MMLLYHRPVPAKIPKRRSRAGKHYPIPSAASCNVAAPNEYGADCHNVVTLQAVFIGKLTQSSNAFIDMLTTFLARKKRRNVMKNDHNVIVASNEV